MQNATKSIGFSLLGAILSLLVACGGGGGGGGGGGESTTSGDSGALPASVATISGTIADGYLRDAQVFLDRNGNRRYDNGEPTTQSGHGGAFSLEINPGEERLYSVVALIVAGRTVDEDSGLAVAKSYQLESPANRWKFVSPLTTLVKQEMEKNPSFTELQAVLKVRSAMGIDDGVSLFSDYLANGTGGAQVQSAQLGQEYTRTHNAARVVAGLMAELQAEIQANLGGSIKESERDAVVLMVSDQILEQAPTIKQALNAERNNDTPFDAVALTNSIKTAVQVETLDVELLSRYQDRLGQELPNWDMSAPKPISRIPASGATSSIDVTIGIIFDEPLDASKTNNASIGLKGPSGPVSGVVSYDAAQKRLSFKPDQVLLPFSSYEVTLKQGVSDTLGNPLAEDVAWNFETIFDKTPPPLPDF